MGEHRQGSACRSGRLIELARILERFLIYRVRGGGLTAGRAHAGGRLSGVLVWGMKKQKKKKGVNGR